LTRQAFIRDNTITPRRKPKEEQRLRWTERFVGVFCFCENQERPRSVHFGIEPEADVEAVPARSVAPLPPPTLPPLEPPRALDAVVPDPPLALLRPAGGRGGADCDGDGDGGAATPLTGAELLA